MLSGAMLSVWPKRWDEVRAIGVVNEFRGDTATRAVRLGSIR